MKKAVEENKKSKIRNEKYYNQKSNVKVSEVKKGDWVLIRQKRKNKLTAKFCSKPLKVQEVNGSAIILDNSKKMVVRNVNDVKRIPHFSSEDSEDYDESSAVSSEDEGSTVQEGNIQEEAENAQAVGGRPVRDRQAPRWQQDYVME